MGMMVDRRQFLKMAVVIGTGLCVYACNPEVREDSPRLLNNLEGIAVYSDQRGAVVEGSLTLGAVSEKPGKDGLYSRTIYLNGYCLELRGELSDVRNELNLFKNQRVQLNYLGNGNNISDWRISSSDSSRGYAEHYTTIDNALIIDDRQNKAGSAIKRQEADKDKDSGGWPRFGNFRFLH